MMSHRFCRYDVFKTAGLAGTTWRGTMKKVLFASLAWVAGMMATLFAPPEDDIVFDNNADAGFDTAPPTDVGRSRIMLKLVLVLAFVLLLTVMIVASPPILGAVGLIVALMLAVYLVRCRAHQTYDNFVDKMIALALAWRRNGVNPSAFA